MLTILTVLFSLFFIGLTGWTITTYVTKEEFQKLIKEELSNMFEITKMFFVSIKSLIQLLIKASFPSVLDESIEIDDQLLKFVPKTSDKQEENKAA
ncbi:MULTISPECIES: hypothetical protein [unclassified Prochlorococcus]|nr:MULTISPECIES: hypothetical protein [unclassified Prochlorococcus]KGG14870.1 hypothetical protein EV06_1933 [Prochlorococcus sp. MIT 0602]